MAKKIVKVEDKKETKKNLDLGSIASVVMENKDAALKIVDGISDIVNANSNKKSTKKTTKTTKKTTKKESKSDLENIIDIAGKILK